MKRLLASLALIGLLSSPALADGTIDTLLGAAALVGTESVPIFQTANPAVKTTSGAIGNAGTLTGDATKAASSTAVTLATVNANVGSFGSATNCVAFTTNGKGLITAASAVTCTPGIASVTGLGTGIATALGVNVGTAGSVVVNGGAGGTPSSLTATNLTGTAAGLTAGNVTTNANLTGMVTSVGNAASLGSFTSANLAAALTDETGTGANVFGTAPTISSLNATTAMTLAFLTSAGTQCVQVSSAGALSGTGSACGGSGSTGANPTATASDTAVNGVATTFMRSDAAPAIQKASNAQFGLAEGDGQTITCTAGVCGFLTSGNAQVGTTYAVLSTDKGKIITLTNASPVAVTIPVASTSGFGSTFYTSFINEGAGLVTLTPTTSTIDGAASLTLKQFQSVDLVSDGTNYFTTRGRPTNVAASDLVGIGTNVAAAVNTTLSAAGGLTSTIASGTAAMGTSAIASGACATVVTVTATNVATTDVLSVGYNVDPTAVTGYGASATGAVLTIYPYPTAGNANFKVCNSSSASITPSALTVNWSVKR